MIVKMLDMCKECGAVTIRGKTNHWYYCAQWNGKKGVVGQEDTAHYRSVVKLANTRASKACG